MRTTLDIDEDVLQAAKERAARERKTAGKLISEWARRGLHAPVESSARPVVVNGFELLPAQGRLITNELVRQLLEEMDGA